MGSNPPWAEAIESGRIRTIKANVYPSKEEHFFGEEIAQPFGENHTARALPALFFLSPQAEKRRLRPGIYSCAARIDSNTFFMNGVTLILWGDLGKTKLRSNASENNVHLIGQRLFVLDGEFQAAGYKTFNWRADNLASGVYFCRLSAQGIDGDKFMKTKKIVIIK